MRIPPGEFLMGADDADMEARDNERPRHLVRISRPFDLGATEVTVGMFRAFVDETGYLTVAEVQGEGTIYNRQGGRFEKSKVYHWRNPGLPRPQGKDEPVVQIAWNDAVAFCDWLSFKEGRTYRLPTEAEWEYACRAREPAPWCWGDDPRLAPEYGWFRDRNGNTTHPVGLKRPNAFGLFDMHGNVAEWCLDVYGVYSGSRETDPIGAVSGPFRVVKGGACSGVELSRASSSARVGRKPVYSYFKYGFRLCRPVTETDKMR